MPLKDIGTIFYSPSGISQNIHFCPLGAHVSDCNRTFEKWQVAACLFSRVLFRYDETVTERRKTEPRMTEARKWPKLKSDRSSKVTEPRSDRTSKWPNLESDRTSKWPNLEVTKPRSDQTSKRTEPRLDWTSIGLNLEWPNLKWDWTSYDWTSNEIEPRKWSNKFNLINLMSVG